MGYMALSSSPMPVVAPSLSTQIATHNAAPAAESTQAVVFIAGDIHYDGGASAFPLWLDKLQSHKPARLIILGDLFEYWLDSDEMINLHAPVLQRLKKLAAAGWQLDLVLGNREIAAGRRLSLASGCRPHWPSLDIRLQNTKIRIVHGDRLCYDPSYRFFATFMRAFFWRGWYPFFPGFIQNHVAKFIRQRSAAKQQRRVVQRGYSRVFIDRRKVQAAGRYCDVLIAGHIHQCWRRTIGGVDMMLVGDWPTGQGHWITLDAYGQAQSHQATWS
jgi:UDP-2,3-diacylglucosamine hydrolase